ncbi:Pirin [Fulvivirga imtechensis AK7]|uniref:Pirin n=1 Tax=Fulvivirga imtechensis AK7 TaxID=1237149 RepID=L8JKM0_9BACT|nr:pirin family protein [Fulvivirga imtechensis]ELR68748.1 Pirin [Fulvivirga imtechensis AK7]
MRKVLHRAETRGHANHGWLDSHHTFSFAGYHNPERMHFGMLRVLNDDVVGGGGGFGTHPHDNMEIVSIPLKGALEHKDSMGNSSVIRTHDVQIMSAGTGIMHSEYNHSATESVNFLQIWIYPKERNINPRYGQQNFDPKQRVNRIKTVVSPDSSGGALWINQDAYFSLATFMEGFETDYKLRDDNHGVYIFIIEGEVEVAGESLTKRDGLGVFEVSGVAIKAIKDSEILFIEVPMTS